MTAFRDAAGRARRVAVAAALAVACLGQTAPARPVVAAAAIGATVPRLPGVGPTRRLDVKFQVLRDFTLHFDHRLGAAEAKRRVLARLEDLRRRFANVASSTETWSGGTGRMRVAAFGQTADGRVDIADRSVDVRVHLPLLLAPLGGYVEAFLQKTGAETLRP